MRCCWVDYTNFLFFSVEVGQIAPPLQIQVFSAGTESTVCNSLLHVSTGASLPYSFIAIGSRAAVAKIFPDVFDKVTVIAYTKEIPNDTVSVRKGLSADLKMKIRDGLKKVSRSPQGSKVLKKLYGISGFTDLDGLFDPVREAGRLLNLNLGDLNP